MRFFRKRRPRLSLELLGWVLLLGFIGWRLSPQVAAALGLGASGGADAERVPPLALQTLQGTPLSNADLQGKVVLVNFWATWCPPCRLEMPGFQRVYEAKKDRGFVILGISTDNAGPAAVQAFLAERGITYPVAMATPTVVSDFGGVQALPTSYLVGRDGTIRQRVTGIFAEPALRLAVDRLLDEPTGGEG